MSIGASFIDRLATMRIARVVYSVTGDYSLELLEGSEWLRVVGDRNGLNAAYAADREARLRGISAVTTPGLGNLVGLPGIAGSYPKARPRC